MNNLLFIHTRRYYKFLFLWSLFSTTGDKVQVNVIFFLNTKSQHRQKKYNFNVICILQHNNSSITW